MKKEVIYLGKGERMCCYLDKDILDFRDEAASGRAAPSKNEVLRRLMWLAAWELREGRLDPEDLPPDKPMSEWEEDDRTEPLPLEEWLEAVENAPWVPDFPWLPGRAVEEKFPLLSEWILYSRGYVKLVSHNYTSEE